jgi:hypothetical protein
MLIRIGFSKPKSFWSNPLAPIIRWVTQSECNHTLFIYYDSTLKTEMVAEADIRFSVKPLATWLNKNVLIDSFVPNKANIDQAFVNLVNKYLDTPYDWGEMFGTIVPIIGKLLGQRWHNPLANNRAVDCSEAAVVVLQESHYPISEFLDPHATTPGDLLYYFKKGLL